MKMNRNTLLGTAVAIATLVAVLRAQTEPREREHHKPQKTSALGFHDTWRKLWEDHITWTRMVILSVFDNLPGANAYTARLIENYEDMEDALRPYYGDDAEGVGDLIADHLTIAVDILNAAKAGDTAAFEAARARWYQNADDIAHAMARLNPRHWEFDEADPMWRGHLDVTLEEAVAHLSGDFEGDVAAYEKVHLMALDMADFFSDGVMRQFENHFTGLGDVRERRRH